MTSSWGKLRINKRMYCCSIRHKHEKKIHVNCSLNSNDNTGLIKKIILISWPNNKVTYHIYSVQIKISTNKGLIKTRFYFTNRDWLNPIDIRTKIDNYIDRRSRDMIIQLCPNLKLEKVTAISMDCRNSRVLGRVKFYLRGKNKVKKSYFCYLDDKVFTHWYRLPYFCL